MIKQSAGILVFRQHDQKVEVLLVHPGGPFWAKKDSWSVPKGELEENEDELSGAKREFREETNFTFEIHDENLIDLSSLKQGSSKINHIWAIEADPDLKGFSCNTIQIEWPPHSGQKQEIPENDRVDWFELSLAKQKIFKSQIGFIDQLAKNLGVDLNVALPETAKDSARTSLPQQQSLL